MVIYIFSLFMGGFGAWLIVRYGAKLGIDDEPNHRSSHKKIVPKGGGIGILISLSGVCVILSVPSGFWLPAIMISLVSFYGGDKHFLKPKTRLFFQFICSLFFLFTVYFNRDLNFNTIVLLFPLSIFMVGTSNFFNFMDGIDGIAGISAMVGFILLLIYSNFSVFNETYLTLCISMVFACAGFLYFNLPKAKVFLGDVGSILLGFVFSCMIVVLSKNLLDFLIMAGFLSTFYFDELFTMIVRIHDGDSLILAHRKHVYQLLANEFLIPHWKISLTYGFIQLIMGLAIIYVGLKGISFLLAFYLLYAGSFILVASYIHKKAASLCE